MMKLRSMSTRDENKVRLIDQKVDVVKVDDKFYLFFPNQELSLEIETPFHEDGALKKYKYELVDGEVKAWFEVQSYDTIYTIETLI